MGTPKRGCKKDVAKKRTAANMTGGGPPKPDTYDDPLYAKILSLIHHAAVDYHNPFDSDIATSQPLEVVVSNSAPEKQDNINDASQHMTEVEDQEPNTSYQQEAASDWSSYTPRTLRIPLSAALVAYVVVEEVDGIGEDPEKKRSSKSSWMSRQRPTLQKSSLEKLHQQKIAALQLQVKLAEDERADG